LRPDTGTARAAVDRTLRALGAAWRLQRTARESRLAAASRSLGQLDPLAVLARGYSLVTDADGCVVTGAAQAPPGSRLDVRFAAGSASVEVVTSRPDRSPAA
jgi:exodeoxyribonuclease VII large subunit